MDYLLILALVNTAIVLGVALIVLLSGLLSHRRKNDS